MINKLIQTAVAFFFFLFPVFFLSTTADAYEYNKMALLVVAALVLFFLFCLKIIRDRRLVLVGGSFGNTLFLLALVVCASTLLQSPNLVVALTTPLSISTIVAGFLFYFLLVNYLSSVSGAGDASGGKDQLFIVILFSSVLVCLYTILLFTNVLPASNLTPAGNLFATALFLSVVAIYLLTKLITIFIQKKNLSNLGLPADKAGHLGNLDLSTLIFSALSLLIFTATIILIVFHLATDQKPFVLGANFGWSIFAEAAKNVKTLFLGVGPTNFITAFTLGKPVSFNSSPYWNIIFTSSSSFLLNLATEAGVVAAALFIIIFFKSFKLLIKSIHDCSARQPITYNQLPFQVALVFALFLQIIFPGSMVLFILTLVLLAFASAQNPGLTIDLTSLHQTPYYLLLLPILASLVVVYFGGRWYLAEMYFKQSLEAALNNQGTVAYNLAFKAINTNSSIDRYYLAFSKLNLVLANALAAKEKPTDEDKQNIPRLVQQSIDNGRNAVVLNRTNIQNWDNLAQTYGALVNFATGSATWAVSSYQQKIQLDPVNPQNHLSFGRLYMNMQKYPEAEDQFRQAIALKPDLAASYYNLALALQEQKKYQEAYSALQTTSALIAPDSKDAETVDNAMKELFRLDPQLAASASAQTVPSAIQPQNLGSNEATSALQNLPTPIPTISLAPPPITP